MRMDFNLEPTQPFLEISELNVYYSFSYQWKYESQYLLEETVKP